MTKNKKYQLVVDIESDDVLNSSIDNAINERVKSIARGEIDSIVLKYLSDIVNSRSRAADDEYLRKLIQVEVSRTVGMNVHSCDIRKATVSAIKEYIGDTSWINDLIKREIHDKISKIDLVALASLLNLKDRE